MVPLLGQDHGHSQVNNLVLLLNRGWGYRASPSSLHFASMFRICVLPLITLSPETYSVTSSQGRFYLRLTYQNHLPLLIFAPLFEKTCKFLPPLPDPTFKLCWPIPEQPGSVRLPPLSLFQQCPQVAGTPTAVDRSGFSHNSIAPSRFPYLLGQSLSLVMISAAIKKVHRPPRYQPPLLQMQLYQEILSSPFEEGKENVLG